MKVLLDTHVWIWAAQEPERIHSVARDILEIAGNHVGRCRNVRAIPQIGADENATGVGRRRQEIESDGRAGQKADAANLGRSGQRALRAVAEPVQVRCSESMAK